MLSFRGDVHKFYLKLKNAIRHGDSIHELSEIIEINEIQQFYHRLSVAELVKIRYRMIKEQKGNGMVPLLVTALPWLAFILSKQLQSLFSKGMLLILGFLVLYTFLITASTVLHYREKAWASVHIEIIDDILKERKERS